jgi:putative transposase
LAVKTAISSFGLSERRICGIVNFQRSTNRYHPIGKDEQALRDRIKELAKRHNRFGSPRLHILLKREGLVENHKRTERIYREEGLSLPKKKKKKSPFPMRVPMPPATRPNEVWSLDFLSDACMGGRKLRILTMIDDFSRIPPGILVNSSITGKMVTQFIDQVSVLHGYPENIRVDNGPEFTSGMFQSWASERNIQVEYTRPGKPTDNAFIESFNGKLRDECLNLQRFLNVKNASEIIEAWRLSYIQERPHSSLNKMTPYEFNKEYQINLKREELHLELVHTSG